MAKLQVPEESGYDEWENTQYQQSVEDWENREQYGIEW
jgi:hypothetical protein